MGEHAWFGAQKTASILGPGGNDYPAAEVPARGSEYFAILKPALAAVVNFSSSGWLDLPC